MINSRTPLGHPTQMSDLMSEADGTKHISPAELANGKPAPIVLKSDVYSQIGEQSHEVLSLRVARV